MIHSQEQIAKLVERNRYNQSSLDQGEGEKPITVGYLVYEMYKMIKEKEKQIEDYKKKHAIATLALSSYSQDEKDSIIDELTRVITTQLDWSSVTSTHPYFDTILAQVKGSADISNGLYGGQLIDGIANGIGEAIFDNGHKYHGNFMHGVMHGKGRLEFKDGVKYEGEFAKGVMHGHGVFTYANGDVFSGSFAKGKKNGLGIMKNGIDKGMQIASYKDDCNHGLCVQLTGDKKIVAVENYVNDKKNGAWLMYELRMMQEYKDDVLVQ